MNIYYNKGRNNLDGWIIYTFRAFLENDRFEFFLLKIVHGSQIETAINCFLSKVTEKVSKAAARFVLREKESGSLMRVMPQPRAWFSLQGHVNNLRLGNRMKNGAGIQGKDCPWCAKQGITTALNEVHVIMTCQGVNRLRDSQGVSDYIRGMMGV